MKPPVRKEVVRACADALVRLTPIYFEEGWFAIFKEVAKELPEATFAEMLEGLDLAVQMTKPPPSGAEN